MLQDPPTANTTAQMTRRGLCAGTFGIFILYGCVGAVGRLLRKQRDRGQDVVKDRQDTSICGVSLGSSLDLRLDTPEDFRRQTLPVTGEKGLTVYVLRRASTLGLILSPAGHHISNSKVFNLTFPKRQ